ncbi:MAG: class I SAM-dependent methyltransferase, partial [Deltaproteobacteria bacterium]|nr:class I SAM-dependent methyltransferase [Deltaproteobacteria bacterium]
PPEGPSGLFVVNPPYGERLGEAGELGPLYSQLGDVLKHRFPGWSAWVLSGNRALDKRIGLRPASRRVVMNGPIECRWLEIPIGERAKTGGDGPGWRKTSAEAEMFENRLRKNHKRLSRWALQNETSAYRLYDADIPEFNVAVDVYGDDLVRVEEYRRPKKVEEATADRRLRDVMLVVPQVLGVRPNDVVLRVRGRGGEKPQIERRGDSGTLHPVYDGQEIFLVNLQDYLDTGLFLDDRDLRRRIRSTVGEGRFLNLFCHTGAASVSAAAGGARSTTSVDLSRRYLDWARENFQANELDLRSHEFVKADALRWLRNAGKGHERWDLVLLAPPTYSRSKGMDDEFDVQRDHVRVIEDAAALLAKGGELLFTTNLRTFALDELALRGLRAEEITAAVTPLDFTKKPRIRAWSIKRS